EDERGGQNESSSSVVTLSDIAVTAKSEARGLTVWATSLSTAQTLERVRVRVFSNKNQLLGEGLTGADGLVTIAGLHPAEGETAAVLLADRISAPATLPSEDSSGLEEGEKPQEQRAPVLRNEGLTWMDLRGAGWDMADADVAGRAYARGGQEAFVYTDRGVYRPGETVHLRAIVRRGDGGSQQAMPVRWLIRRPDLREWKQQVTIVDADGSASLDLALPDDLTTGRWTAQIGLPGEATAVSTFGSRTFLVEEFMPNRLKVGLGFASKGIDASRKRATIGEEPLRAVVQADYLFGRPAAGLQTKLTARLDPSGFQPADWADWTFGDSARVLDSGNVNGPGAVDVAKAEDAPDLSTRALNEIGRGEWPLQLRRLLKLPPATRPATTQSNQAARYMGPWQLAVEASVQEVGGRSVSAADSIQVDALPWYIGVHRNSNGPALPGSPSLIDVGLVAPSGTIAAQEETLEVSLFRESWNNLMTFREGRYRYESHRVLEPVSDAAPREVRVRYGRGKIAVTPPSSGAYVLRVYDGRRGGMTTVQFYASNGGGWEDNVSREHPEKVEVIVLPPDDTAGAMTRPATVQSRVPRSPKLKIGQTARVLIRSPFAGRLLFTVETDRVISTRVIEMSGSSVEVPLEVSESLRPNAYLSASVIRAIDPQAKWRTHRAHGTTRLTVDPADRRLAIEIVTPPEVRPLSTLGLGLRVTDATGRPVPNAPVTVAAVDEGILQLTSFHTPDPLGFFYADRALAVASSDIFGQLMPEVARPEKVSAVGGDKGAGGTPRYRSPVTARRVRPVALFAVVRTDEQGYASTHLSIPEFAGQLRIMAVAHAGAQYGATDRPLFVRAPLLVQSSFPRFAAPGDRFVAPITLFNNGKVAMNVTLSAELLGATEAAPLAFAATPEAKLTFEAVSIKAGEQHVFGLPCVAADRVGVARVRLMASAGNESCTETTELPIRPPSPFISSGGFAVVSPGAGEPLDLKNEFLAGTEQTLVTLTPMPSLQLPQAIDYLERYPYGCAEQTVSTSFALLYLDEIGRSVAPGVFEKQRVADKVQAGILRLLGMQTSDGGLAMWPGSRESWPWASIYAAHFLVEARAAGHAVPEDFQKRLLGYVHGLLDRAGDGGDLLESQAYASYVLALSGKPDRAFMSRLGELTRVRADGAEESAIRAQARLHLSLAWLAAGRRDLASEYLPSSLPGVRLKRQGGGNVGSPVRDRAMILNTLLTVRPEDPAIPALASQLAEAKWQSTQEIAFAAMAIGKYLRQAKTYEPYDRAELLLDGIPMVAGTGAVAWNVQPLQRHFLGKITGPPATRGYLTWTRSGVPLAIPPNEDHGIKVRRRYLDEHGKPLQSNKLQSGDLVLVELTVEASAAQRNLVIEDLLPAGLEIENSRLETTASLATGNAKRSSKDVRDELREARLDVRDDRMIVFGHLAENGLARHVYAARAVVPGTFVLPPVRVECMYDPGTSSLWGPGGTLEVKRAESRTIVGVPGGD
ncbi:MAG: alpha-2-macroglobulin domain protein, partial [Phycisphaerales bacterium]|nr:alpha-2-macroglobulin domain protein [Phycisphaerales bacterium]